VSCIDPNTLQLAVAVVLSFQWLAQGKEAGVKHPTLYRTVQIDGLSIFYREAGPKDAPHAPAAARAAVFLAHVLTRCFVRLADRYHLVRAGLPRLRP